MQSISYIVSHDHLRVAEVNIRSRRSRAFTEI